MTALYHNLYVIIAAVVLLSVGCKNAGEPNHLVGEWNIDTYEIYYEENGEVITDLRYEDAGEFILNQDGTGNATIATPGSSLPQNQPITWLYDEETQKLTIDYDTMEGPYIYDVEVISQTGQQWVTTGDNGSVTTVTLTKR